MSAGTDSDRSPTQGGGLPSQGGDLPSQGGDLPSQGGDLPSQGGGLPTQGGDLPSQGGGVPTQGSVCILPHLPGLGGPASFQANLIRGLAKVGVRAHHNPLDPTCRSILVIGGTRQLDLLWRARRRGVRIVQRLNGMHWLHRKRKVSLRYYLQCELNNRVLAFIRRFLADEIVYQSRFARDWWHSVHGRTDASACVIYNGVDLQQFHPSGEHTRPSDRFRVLVVETNISGGFEVGLENAIALIKELASSGRPVELMVVGKVPEAIRPQYEAASSGLIRWAGLIGRDAVASVDRSAHVLFSADLNAACPNSVLEALACGLPVAAFATGSLPELVNDTCGRVVPWGGDCWKLEPADTAGLARAVQEIFAQQEQLRPAARRQAEAHFGLDAMVEQYLKVLL